MSTSKFTVSVNIDIYQAKVTGLLIEKTGASARKAAEKTQERARKYAPSRTGELRRSITIKNTQTSTKATYTVGSPLKYALYQEEGTGPIYARPGGVLVFTPKGGGGPVFARRTSGVPAVHFMRDAYLQIRLADFL